MKFKRLVTIMLTLSVAVSLVAFPVAAVDYSDVVAPLYIGLEDATADLAISSNGYANCSGSAYVANGYNATVVMELQQKNGTWKPIKRWSKSGGYRGHQPLSWLVDHQRFNGCRRGNHPD